MPLTEAPLLEATGLVRAYGRRRALRGVDLSLAAGETLVVLGPNGAGKTTLLRLLAGLMRPTGGEVRVMGLPLKSGDTNARRPIGLLSHQSMLYDDLTVAENLLFAAGLYGLLSPREAVARALEEAGLSDRAADLPRNLSRGMQQRAAIARALLHRPSLLLLDEPFTGLDASASDRLRESLRAETIKRSGMVVVTHHAAEAWELATHVGVLVGGRWAIRETRPDNLDHFLRRYQEAVRA
ncbi:MAG: heme ABC exporter ATP-binding protein CcmA [Gemmatimonadota bacterium]